MKLFTVVKLFNYLMIPECYCSHCIQCASHTCICVGRFVSVSDLWEPVDNGTDNQVK